MKSARRSIIHVIVLLLLAGGIAASAVSLSRSRAVRAEAERFTEALTAWESQSRYYNPLDLPAVLLSFAPGCTSCRIEIEQLADVYQPGLPIVGISVNPYPDSPLRFTETVSGEEAMRLRLLYGLTLDTVLFVDGDGALINEKSPRGSTAAFYRAALEARP